MSDSYCHQPNTPPLPSHPGRPHHPAPRPARPRAPPIARFLAQPDPSRTRDAGALAVLTEREREVLGLVATGLSNEEIANQLVVSPHTAKTHINRAMAKLGAHDRAQLVIYAYESGLVRAPGPPDQGRP